MKNEKDYFNEKVFKPMFAVAFGTGLFTILLDYSFQLIDAIETIVNY